MMVLNLISRCNVEKLIIYQLEHYFILQNYTQKILKKNSIKKITKNINNKKFKLSDTSKYYLNELYQKSLLKKSTF